MYTLIETPYTPNMNSKLFLTDDPALMVLYAQLRSKTLQTLRGASKVTPKIEWDFVLHNARLYDRMGCDLLGLDLVRNWEFLLPGQSLKPGLGGDIVDPLKLLRRRSSLVVQDLPMSPITAPGAGVTRRGSSANAAAAAAADGNSIKSPTTPGGGEKSMKAGKAQPPPTMFEEPDANSLLDSFGF